MKKKLLLIIALLCTFAQVAWADEVNLSTLTADYTVNNGDILTGSTSFGIIIPDGATITLNNATISRSGRWECPMTCEGSATIIIDDGSVNLIQNTESYYQSVPGITVGPSGSTLIINGNTGQLTVQGGAYASGIGVKDAAAGNVIINGGVLSIYGGGDGAGIGADTDGSYTTASIGDITINGGELIINGRGCGIGAIDSRSSCGTITINDGNINVTGSYTGIGGRCTAVKIKGGSLIASGGNLCPGIGGASCQRIEISGGTVTADCRSWGGAGIGSGYQQTCGNIIITGGTVTATGGTYGATGIGVGSSGSCGNIYIGPSITSVTAYTRDTDLETYPPIKTNSTLLIASSLNDVTEGGTRTLTPSSLPPEEELHQDDEGNYLIGSIADWKLFAFIYDPTANVKLTADIDLETDLAMIGNSSAPYRGVFNGQGHTLTVNWTTTGDYCAPFPYINGATFKNLHVTGTINTSHRFTGGLIGKSIGTSYINNCHSSVEMISSYNGDAVRGGFAASVEGGSLNFNDCIFDGKFEGSSSQTWGGFVGWKYSYTVNIENGLFIPKSVNVSATYSATFSGNGGTVNNSYYTVQINNSNQGTFASAEQLADGSIAYKLQANRANLVWGQRIGTDPEPVLTNDENYRVYRSINGGYTNDSTLAYEGLQQDADDNYLIGSVWDWQDFAALVNGGTTTANAKMTADINLGDDQTVIGATTVSTDAYSLGSGYHYKGVFDGQGHTLTVAYNATDNNSASPFSSIEGATIKNMHIAGSMVSPKACGAGVASATGGTGNVIQNVWVSATIIGNGLDWNCSASIVGCVKNGSVTISDCLFTGSVTSVFHHNGCFVGYIDSGSASIDNSLSTGTFSYGGCAWQGTHNYCYVKEFPATYPAGVTQPTDAELTNGTTTTALNNGRTGDDALWVQDPITNQPMLKLFASSIRFINDGNWDVADNWNIGAVPAAGSDVTIAAAATIPQNCLAIVGNITIADGGSLTIADGGGLIHSNDGITATVEKNIEAWTTGTPVGGWYFIASPISTTLEPNNVTNLLTEPVGVNYTYDLYRYDHSETLPWQNYHQHMADFHMTNGQGFLYANAAAQTLEFSGTLKPYSTESNANQVTLAQDGWNLIGNPFSCPVTVSTAFAEVNNGSMVTNKNANCVILPCRGIAVYGNAGEKVTFTAVTPVGSAALDNNNLQIALTQANTRGNSQIDNAIVSFNQGSTLPKFRFGDDAEIYISQGNEDYAIVSVDSYGELPLNFKAKENGTYSLSVNPEGVEMNYLHLIDNLTGADVNLLQTPSYIFEGKANDYASRFRLVFTANEDNLDNTDNFAFVSDDNIIITDNSTDATLQIVDATGRVIRSTDVARNVSTSGIPAGVYVLRLIDGNDVKTQKIVVE